MKCKMEHRMDCKVEEKIACVCRELITKIDHGVTSVGNHVDELEQKITRTYSSQSRSCVWVNGLTQHQCSMVPHRSESTSIPPSAPIYAYLHSSFSIPTRDGKCTFSIVYKMVELYNTKLMNERH